jgi:hypothetical protein
MDRVMSEEMQSQEAELSTVTSVPGRDVIGVADDPLSHAEQRGDNRDGGKSPADDPASAGDVAAEKIAKLKAEIADLWPHGRDRRIVIGRLLIQLHDLLSKQGSGCFMKTIVGELHIPYTTAAGYMAEAREFDNPSCYEIRNNEPSDPVATKPAEVSGPGLQTLLLQEKEKVGISGASSGTNGLARFR